MVQITNQLENNLGGQADGPVLTGKVVALLNQEANGFDQLERFERSNPQVLETVKGLALSQSTKPRVKQVALWFLAAKTPQKTNIPFWDQVLVSAKACQDKMTYGSAFSALTKLMKSRVKASKWLKDNHQIFAQVYSPCIKRDQAKNCIERTYIGVVEDLDRRTDARIPQKKKQPVTRAVGDHVHFSTGHGYYNSSVELGGLPLNDGSNKLLLKFAYVHTRTSQKDDFTTLSNVNHQFSFESQYQHTFRKGSDLFARLQYDYLKETNGHNLLGEMVYREPGEALVLRTSFAANDLAGEDGPVYNGTLAYFVRIPIYKSLGLRLGAEHAIDSNYNNTMIPQVKVDGAFRSDPWWGWGIQAFFPADLTRKAEKPIDFAGVYLWSGGVIKSPSFLAKILPGGLFAEGGIWIGKTIGQEQPFYQDLIAGMGLKLKFGPDARWWP